MDSLLHSKAAALFLLMSMLVASATFAADGESTAFDQVAEHYESVRLALTNDSTDGISEHGKKIAAILEELSSEWSSAAAGVRADMAEDVRDLLPELSEAATALSAATTLDAARDAFYDLSKPLVRWRKAAVGDKLVVAYCPMAKRSWLQPEGELGNPYYGQSMLRCGEVVDA
ncbi:MAG: DUF3347 domain-containing protein [Acidobacteriota bacterium]|jgi:hypothetical protein|nr:DUF3347 domain-containing protein [Acidobacteriota bacterium]